MPTVNELLCDPSYGLVREARPSQLTMAAAIEAILKTGGVYFCEAPVATGKTYAYLVPALLAQGLRVVVATAKKQLQDQIVGKDYPTLKQVLGTALPPGIAVPLKGKGNYACGVSATPLLAKNPEDRVAYEQFLQQSPYGDQAEYAGTLPRWWGSATAEDCVGKHCAAYDNCGYIRLKRDATQSKLIVINHHVLGAEMSYGHGKLVGGAYDVLVIDEAHTLADGIRAAFTHRVAEDSLRLLQDVLQRTSHTFPAVRAALPVWDAMFAAVPDRHFQEAHTRQVPVFEPALATPTFAALQAILGALLKVEKLYTQPAAPPDEPPDDIDTVNDGLDDAATPDAAGALAEVTQTLGEGSSRNLAQISQAIRRVEALLKGLQMAQGIVETGAPLPDPVAQAQRLTRILANTVVSASQDERGRFGVDCAPVNVGGIAGEYLRSLKAVVVCSATLAVEGGFEHVVHTTGLTPTKAEVLPTAFNYARQGFVYIPRNLPAVSRTHPEYAPTMERRIAQAVQLVEWSQGGAFILTTANEELDAFTAALKARFPNRTFAQGHRKNAWDGGPNAVLRAFRATPDAILVGSKSFWEGVDVPGGALRLVIIAKLPFPQYNDPIIRAREHLAGPNAFHDVQMVDMLIALRQGVGRLIRTKDDRGCVAILDSRVWDKAYGGAVRRALPWPNKLVTSDLAICANYLPKYAAHFRGTASP